MLFDTKKFAEKLTEAHRLSETDPEGAHSLEDALHRQLVDGIVNGGFDSYETLRERATELQKLQKVNFPRWRG